MNAEKVYLIKRRSSGIYYLSITHYDSGKRKLSRISCKTKSKAEALKFFKNYKNEKVEKPDEHTLTIEEAINIIISYSETNLRPNTTLRFKMVFKMLKEFFNGREVESLSLNEMENFKTFLSKRIKKVTVNSYMRTIKSGWSHLAKLGYIKKNKIQSLQLFNIPEKEILSFTDNEIDLIIQNIPDITIKSIVTMAVETGLRISELLNLRFKNIDFDNRLIKVLNTDDFKTKSGRNRIIPFNEVIEQEIKRCTPQSAFESVSIHYSYSIPCSIYIKSFHRTIRT